MPHFAAPPQVSSHCGRRLAQRRRRKQFWVSWANSGIDALNSLSGFQSAGTRVPANAAQRECQHNLAAAYSRYGSKPVDAPSDDAALRALLAAGHCYDGGGASTVESYSFERVAWPDVRSQVCLADGLSDDAAATLRSLPDHMRSVSSGVAGEDQPRVYCDPLLVRSRPAYCQFLAEMQSRGMLAFRQSSDAGASNVGVFSWGRKTVDYD